MEVSIEQWFVILFSTFMFGHFIWNVDSYLERKLNRSKTETELWVEEYQKDVPTVWIQTDTQ